MKEKMKEIYQKATENDWSDEQLEAALKEAGATVEDFLGMQELDLEQMASVAGGAGADPATCQHTDISRGGKFERIPNENSNDYKIKRTSWVYICMRCGQTWYSSSPKFDLIPGWKGTIYKN